MLSKRILAIGFSVQVVATSSLVRLGPTGNRLSVEDLNQIAQICKEAGDTPWVLVGHPRPFDGSARWWIDVYTHPNRTADGIRRGRIQVVIAALPSPEAYDSPKTWQRGSVFEYAQVPVRDTTQDILTGNRDLNRPFRVFGTLSDEALLRIVSLIRSSPSIPAPPVAEPGQFIAPIFTAVQGTWPIASVVMRDATQAEVSLLDMDLAEKSGQKVVLRGTGRTWVIERLFAWTAD